MLTVQQESGVPLMEDAVLVVWSPEMKDFSMDTVLVKIAQGMMRIVVMGMMRIVQPQTHSQVLTIIVKPH